MPSRRSRTRIPAASCGALFCRRPVRHRSIDSPLRTRAAGVRLVAPAREDWSRRIARAAFGCDGVELGSGPVGSRTGATTSRVRPSAGRGEARPARGGRVRGRPKHLEEDAHRTRRPVDRWASCGSTGADAFRARTRGSRASAGGACSRRPLRSAGRSPDTRRRRRTVPARWRRARGSIVRPLARCAAGESRGVGCRSGRTVRIGEPFLAPAEAARRREGSPCDPPACRAAVRADKSPAITGAAGLTRRVGARAPIDPFPAEVGPGAREHGAPTIGDLRVGPGQRSAARSGTAEETDPSGRGASHVACRADTRVPTKRPSCGREHPSADRRRCGRPSTSRQTAAASPGAERSGRRTSPYRTKASSSIGRFALRSARSTSSLASRPSVAAPRGKTSGVAGAERRFLRRGRRRPRSVGPWARWVERGPRGARESRPDQRGPFSPWPFVTEARGGAPTRPRIRARSERYGPPPGRPEPRGYGGFLPEPLLGAVGGPGPQSSRTDRPVTIRSARRAAERTGPGVALPARFELPRRSRRPPEAARPPSLRLGAADEPAADHRRRSRGDSRGAIAELAGPGIATSAARARTSGRTVHRVAAAVPPGEPDTERRRGSPARVRPLRVPAGANPVRTVAPTAAKGRRGPLASERSRTLFDRRGFATRRDLGR